VTWKKLVYNRLMYWTGIQGDLEELFGKVPVYTPPSPPLDSSVFPQFSMDDMHPYHLVVVYVAAALFWGISLIYL